MLYLMQRYKNKAKLEELVAIQRLFVLNELLLIVFWQDNHIYSSPK
jgi:hypothetical protein